MALDIAYKNLNTIAASIGPKYLEGRLEDMLFDSHPFFEKVKANGNIKKSKGTGKTLVQNLRVGSNSTVRNQSMRSTVDLTAQETNTTAEWPWGSIAGSLSFDDVDLHDNMGKEQLVDILQVAMDQLIDTVADRMSVNILSENSATSAFQFLGLKDGVTDDTWIHPADYGGLTTTEVPGFEAYVKNNASTLANLVDDLNNAYNSASFGRHQPDMVLTDQTGEELYRAAMDTNIRYTDTKSGDATINAVTFRGKPLIFDRDVTIIDSTPTGWSGTTDTASTHRFYLLNTSTWEFHWDSKWNMENAIESGWRIPNNQFKRSKLVALRGQFITRHRRRNALVVNVPAS